MWTPAPTWSPSCSAWSGGSADSCAGRRGGGFDAAGLTQSQAELLRLVGRQPGISVREAAAELGLVPNTASTLVSKLSADGLLIRTVDADDRRVGRLRLTEPAQRIADESRAARRAALSAVLDELDADQLDGLAARIGGARRDDPHAAREATMTTAACDRLPAPDPPLRPFHRRRRPRPAGARRRDGGPARPQRRGQDHRGAGADHADPGPGRRGAHLRPRLAPHTMDIRHNIGYVPQQLSIESALTGRQNVELFARLYDVPRRERADRVDEALEAMQLLDVADSAGGHLLRRHGPPPRTGAGAGEPAVAAAPRRTDGRAGSHCARQCLGAGAAHAGGVRHDGAADHPLHGGGRRAVRPGRADAPRPAAGRRLARRTEGRPARVAATADASRTSSATTRAPIWPRTARRPGSARSASSRRTARRVS